MAISLVDVLEKLELKAVVKRYEIDMQKRELPTDEDVRKVVSRRKDRGPAKARVSRSWVVDRDRRGRGSKRPQAVFVSGLGRDGS